MNSFAKAVVTTATVLSSAAVYAKEYRCEAHKHFLALKEQGLEHVNHTLLLNGKTPIKELAQEQWFVETVKCTPSGFDVVANHRQYNDPTVKTYSIIVLAPDRYELESAAKKISVAKQR